MNEPQETGGVAVVVRMALSKIEAFRNLSLGSHPGGNGVHKVGNAVKVVCLWERHFREWPATSLG
jgi:hypothetical protein